MKSYVYGFIINLQFFSIIPIRIEVPLTKENIERSIRTFPLFGLFLGFIYSVIAYILLYLSPFSPLLIAFVLWLLAIVITGGIHLDGWMDTSDALFSYRNQEKRLEIMSDPRTGAFGVISVIVLLAAKFLFIYETVLHSNSSTFILILLIPFFSRMLTGMILVSVPPAKPDGLGLLFHESKQQATIIFYILYIIPALIVLFSWNKNLAWMFLGMCLCILLFFMFFRKKIIYLFGGLTGDIAGASTEGAEVSLWMIVLLLHYFAMV